MAGKGFHVDPGHLHRSGGNLGQFGEKLGGHGQRLAGLGQGLLAHTSGDSSGIGSVISRVFGRALGITGKVFGEGGRVVGEAGKRLQHTAKTFEHVEGRNKGLLTGLHGGEKSPHLPGGVGGGKGGAPGKPAKKSGLIGGIRGAFGKGGKARDFAVGVKNKIGRALGDPVDMATGEMVQSETDVQLAGALPLVLERTHLSSYRAGGWFGRSWASTVDQRVEVDDEGVCFASADGMLLVYPTPADGVSVLPEEGPRWPLARTPDGGYTITNPETGHTFHFESVSSATLPLTAIVDRNGDRIDFDHDAEGVLTEVRHSGGYRIAVDTDEGRITALRLLGADNSPGNGADVTLMRYRYDEAGNLVEVINSSGLPMRFDYDAEGRVVRWEDRRGCWYEFSYDQAGRCVAGVGADGMLNSNFTYDTDNLVTTHTNSLGQTTTFHLNAHGQVLRRVDPLGNATESEWDRYDRLLAETDPLGRTTRYTYDELGNLVAITRPDGSQSLVEYNELRLPITVIDPDGAVWRREYDERGNLLTVTDPAGATTRFGYDEHHHLAAIIDPLGARTRVECDAAGLPVAITDPLGATTRYTRDALGHVATVTDAVGGVTRLGWTIDGRLAWRIQPDGATERWSYDGEGNQVEYIDSLGQSTRTEVTHFDLPVAQTDPTGARTSFTYDTELRLTSVTNPQGLVWRYDYDPASNLVAETDFNRRVLSYAHDAAGQLIERVNGIGQTTSLTRDVLGRVVERRAEDGMATFAYDEADRLVRATNDATELVLTRDLFGRITAETCNGRTVASAYDARGQRTRRVTPTGAETRWEYDAAARPSTLHTAGQTLAFGYDRAGREVSRRFAEITLTQTWDANHRLHTQALTAPASGPIQPGDARQQRLVQRRAYTYRADGAVTNIVDQLAGVRHFDLDQLGRVTQVEGPGYREEYAYDPSGNIAHAAWPTSQAEPAAVGPRVHTGTLVRSAGNIRYEHDGQGRLTTRHVRTLSGQIRTWRYVWNSDDRLIAVTTPDGITWRYTYDPLGRRTAKLRLDPGGDVAERVDFTWDGMVLAEQTHTSGHTTTWNYEPGTFTPLTQTERAPLRHAPQEWIDQQFYAIVTDLVGTPTELVDPNGTVAWHTRTTLWGATALRAAASAYTPLRFPGQYHDPETGFNYNFFRYYDPASARYTTNDPLGLDAGPNPHNYVSNPVRLLDPLGLAVCVPKGAARGAPGFVAGPSGIVEDVRGKGRPNNDLVFSGHGSIPTGDTSMVTVPKGTSLNFYSPHGTTISDSLGNRIETGSPSSHETFGPGQRVPDYILSPPTGLNIKGAPITVTADTRLSQLLRPNQGNVHWAACREIWP